MTKQTKIVATEARFPLASLSLSEMNPRQNVPEKDVIELAESIWTAGLIQNIAGFVNVKGQTEIVAGGRRLRALQYLATQHRDMAKIRPELANPMVMLAPDISTAEAWANLENVARRDLHPAEEIQAYGKMEAKGSTPSLIARTFAVTEKHVYRRLALSHLAAPILEALAAGEINLSMASCFTICDDEKHSLEVLERVRGDSWSDHQLKNLLKPDSVKESDRRAKFVGEEAYKAAGGRMGSDLFAEEILFDSPEILEGCFRVAVEDAARKTAEDQGWKWVKISENSYVCSYSMGLEKYGRIYKIEGELTEEQNARHDELTELSYGDALDEAGEVELKGLQKILDGDYSAEQKEHSGAYIYVDGCGELAISGGFVLPEDTEAAVEAGILEISRHSSASTEPKSPISQKLQLDLDRIVVGARQVAMLEDPKLALHLLAFQLAGEMGYNSAFGLRSEVVVNVPTTETGYVFDDRLVATEGDSYVKSQRDHAKDFAAFRKMGDAKIMQILNNSLVAQLSVSNEGLGAMIDNLTKKKTRETFTPTAENFFCRVGGPYLNVLWRDLVGLAEDHPTAITFAKLKKVEKAEKMEALFGDEATREALTLTEKQVARINAWLPEGTV